MRKIKIVLLLIAGYSSTTYAQQDFFSIGGSPGTTQLSQDDGSQYVGIGVNPTGGAAALSVTNFGQTTTPVIGLEVLNKISSASTTGSSNVSFGVGRMIPSNYTNGNGIADLIVDGGGLVGIGGGGDIDMNGNINAHLYVTDQNGDGYPLFAAYTNVNNPGMVIDQNGNVGIGTSTPPSSLSVVSPAAYIGTLTNLVNIVNSPIAGLGDPGSDPTYTPNSFTINRIAGTSTLTDFIVSSSGNVGIGTATPGDALDVVGNAGVSGYLLVGGNTIIGGNSSINGTSLTIGVANFSDNINVTGNAAVAGNGTIGNTLSIGSHTTNSDQGTLTIDAVGLGSGGYATTIQVSDPTVKAFAINQQCQTSGCTGNTDKFVILADGRTAIGDFTSVVSPALPNGWTSSNTGGYMLYVNGGVLATSYKCALSSDATNWSDYVFDRDYKLASLNEVEKYIKDNHHLPDVPSTDDVHCDGIDLAQMDATLLKKIEELTLYVLDLKKDNEAMKAEISNLKK